MFSVQWPDHAKLQKLSNYNLLVATIILHIKLLCSIEMTFRRHKGVSLVFDS